MLWSLEFEGRHGPGDRNRAKSVGAKMSFDVWLGRFSAGTSAPFSRQCFERIFAPHVVEREPIYHRLVLSYPDGGGGDVYIEDGEEISGFTVNRPGVEGLFNDLFQLMKEVGAVVYWGSGIVVVEPRLAADLPPVLLAAVGPAITVRSGAEIMEAIARS